VIKHTLAEREMEGSKEIERESRKEKINSETPLTKFNQETVEIKKRWGRNRGGKRMKE
jgi:hypothetical protein